MNVLATWNDNRYFKLKKNNFIDYFLPVSHTFFFSNGTEVKYEIVQRDDNENDLYEIR